MKIQAIFTPKDKGEVDRRTIHHCPNQDSFEVPGGLADIHTRGGDGPGVKDIQKRR